MKLKRHNSGGILRDMVHIDFRYSFLPMVTILMQMIHMPLVGAADRYSNCLGRCHLEVVNTHELFVRAEDILSFQRFFDPEVLGETLRDVTSLRVECSQALLGEKVRTFQSTWIPLISRLLEFQIHGCRVVSLAPMALMDFRSLTSLRIDNADEGSPFMALEGGLEGLKNLASFTLTRVRLRSLNHSLFHNHTANKLMKIYLNHNSLDDIDQCTFCGMQRLSDLDLSFNKLTGSDLEFLNCIHALYFLNMSHNVITEIKSDASQYNEILHTLDLSHNKLKSFPSVVNFLNRTKSLKEVYLASNPWLCNVSSLVHLKYLEDATGLQVKDWNTLQCLEKGKWISVQKLVFPFSFGHIFRFWHFILIAGLILMCICSVLAIKCMAEPPDDTLPVAMWRLARRSLRPSSRRMSLAESLPSKFQRSEKSSRSKLQNQQDEHQTSESSGSLEKNNSNDSRRNGQATGVSEVIIGNIIVENSKKVGSAAPSPLIRKSSQRKRKTDDSGASSKPMSESQTERSYISYKTTLEPDAEGTKDEKSPRSKSKRREKDKEKHKAHSPECQRDGDKGKSDGDDTVKYSEAQNDDDLPLSTSAGVATTPTETQTMAMAGVRGIGQYGLASWMTVAQPHLSTSLDNPDASPSHHLPTPVEFMAAKQGHRNMPVDFTLHSPPSLHAQRSPGLSGESLRNSTESQNIQNYSQNYGYNGTNASPIGCQPVILEERRSLRNIWSATRVYPSGRATDRPVCHSCLEALSLPDVNNGDYLWDDEQDCRSSLQQSNAFRRAPSSLRQQRARPIGMAGDEKSSPSYQSRYSHYIRKPGKNTADKPMYRSLERGTKRRAVEYRRRVSSQDNYYRELSSQDKECFEVKNASQNGSTVSSIAHIKEKSEVYVQQRKSVREPSGIVGSMETEDTSVRKSTSSKGRTTKSNDSSFDTIEKAPVQESNVEAKKCQSEKIENGQESQYERNTRRRSPSTSADEGDHCDIDIEAQASQIIDVVELHAQSNCKTS